MSKLVLNQYDPSITQNVVNLTIGLADKNQLDNYLKVKRLISLFSISYAVKSNYKRKSIINAAIMGYLVDGVSLSELQLFIQDPEMNIKSELMYFKRSMESYETLCFVTQFYTYEDFLYSLFLLSQTPRFEKTANRVMKTLNKKDFFQFKSLDLSKV